MVTKKNMAVAILATFCLTSTLFMVIPIKSQVGTTSANEYDPWTDLNDDGIIDIFDIVQVALAFGAEGTPINKTALLLELQARVAALEKMVPQKGRISISPSAFSPETNGQSFMMDGRMLRGQGEFDAPLQLPNGARITNMTVVLVDMRNNGRILVYLRGYNITNDTSLTIPMAMIETTDSEMPGNLVLYDDTISDNIINNNCEYWLNCFITYNDPLLRITAIMLDYEYLP